MGPLPSHLKVAACHIAPVYLNPEATAEKALRFIDDAVGNGAKVVAFPEAFIPGFPFFAGILAPVDHGTRFSEYVKASIYADGPEIASIREKAKQAGVVVSIGFSERSRHSAGCIWNSNVIIGEDGTVLSHHRKLVATYWEKLVWSAGDGFGLQVGQTQNAGRIGALICGENANPLARFSLMAQEEHIHVASFPPAWPTRREGGYDNRAANMIRGAAHSFEAKAFTIICAGFLDRKAVVAALGDEKGAEVVEQMSSAATQFFGPDGRRIGGEASDKEKIAYAEFDLEACIEAKRLHDVAGGYNRFDVFDLQVNRKRLEPISFK